MNFFQLLMLRAARQAIRGSKELSAPILSVANVTSSSAKLIFSVTGGPDDLLFNLAVNGVSKGTITSPYTLNNLSSKTNYNIEIFASAAGYKNSEKVIVLFDTLSEQIDFSTTKALFLGDSYFADFHLHLPVFNKFGFADKYMDAQGGRRMARTVTDDGRPALADTIDATLAANPTAGFVWVEPITNDAYYKVPIGMPAATERTTFYGALKYVANAIKTALPNALICYSTPMQTPRTTSDGSPVEGTSLDYLQSYISAQTAIFDAAGFKKIDIFNNPRLSLDKINQISTDNIHPDKVYGQVAYTSAIENAISPLQPAKIKSTSIVDNKTIAVTFDSSLLNFNLTGVSLKVGNTVKSFASFAPVAGSMNADLPGSIYNLVLAQPFAISDTLQLIIQGATVTDGIGNSIANGTYDIENNLASIGELLDLGSHLINATWDAQSGVMSVGPLNTGGSTANKRVPAGADAEMYVPATFTPAGNMIIGFGKQVLSGTSQYLYDEADFMAYYDFPSKTVRVFEKGALKHLQTDVNTYPSVKRIGNAIAYLLDGQPITFNQPGAQLSPNASGILYPIATCYFTNSSVKAYLRGTLETYN